MRWMAFDPVYQWGLYICLLLAVPALALAGQSPAQTFAAARRGGMDSFALFRRTHRAAYGANPCRGSPDH